MEIKSVFGVEFKKYGTILKGYDIEEFVDLFVANTELPKEGFFYNASERILEEHKIFEDLQKRAFGGLPIQLGYCNGTNTRLNCVEYHKCSEICIMAHDSVLLLGKISDINNFKYDSKNMEAFFVPKKTGVELFPMTLHYAPCDGRINQGFRVAVALIKGTCGKMKDQPSNIGEDKMLVSVNKWLMAHPNSDEAKSGAFVGLMGDEICIVNDIKAYNPL